MSISLKPAQAFSDWLKTSYSLYLYDLTEFGGGYTLDAHGCWLPDRLGFWLDKANPVTPLVIDCNGDPVGFAFVGRKPFPYMSPDRDYKLSEFFIMRPRRGQGIGRKAVSSLFKQFPGTWEMGILSANWPALLFWRKILEDYADIDLEDHLDEGEILFQFRAK